MYFEDLNSDWIKEILVAIWDKKTFVEAIEYRLSIITWEEPFVEIWHFYGKNYLEYYEEDNTLHAPYSKNWVCQSYNLWSDRVFEL